MALAVVLLALPASALAQQKVLKYAHFQPARPDQPKHAAALAFKEYVEKATNGSIKVEIFPAGQFGNDADTMSGLRLGTLEMAVAHDGAIAVIYKPIGVLGIPFLYDNHEHAWRVYDSPWLKEFSDDMVKKSGVRLLSLADNGVRHFTNSKRTIRAPEVMKGLKIRVMPSPVFQTLVSSLGASPSAIPWAELPTALQQKVVDGQENPISAIKFAKLYEVQKYMTMDGHTFGVSFMLINEKFFQSLPKEYQAIVKNAALTSAVSENGIDNLDNAIGVQFLKEKGMEVYAPTAAQKAEFQAAAQPPIIEYLEKQLGGRASIDKVLRAVKDAEASLEK